MHNWTIMSFCEGFLHNWTILSYCEGSWRRRQWSRGCGQKETWSSWAQQEQQRVSTSTFLPEPWKWLWNVPRMSTGTLVNPCRWVVGVSDPVLINKHHIFLYRYFICFSFLLCFLSVFFLFIILVYIVFFLLLLVLLLLILYTGCCTNIFSVSCSSCLIL